MFKYSQTTIKELEGVKNQSLNALCNIFCKNKSEVPLEIDYLGIIIEIILTSLNSPSEVTIGILLKNTKYIFGLDYRGMIELIPAYIGKISEVLKDKKYSKSTQSAAMSILGSLLCVPDNYPEYEIISFDETSKKTTMKEIKEKLHNEILYIMKNTEIIKDQDVKNDEEAKEKLLSAHIKSPMNILYKAICCSGLIIHQECMLKNPNMELIKVMLFNI